MLKRPDKLLVPTQRFLPTDPGFTSPACFVCGLELGAAAEWFQLQTDVCILVPCHGRGKQSIISLTKENIRHKLQPWAQEYHTILTNIIQCVFFQASSETGLLWACFWTYLWATQRLFWDHKIGSKWQLGQKYFLTRLKMSLEGGK